MIAALHFCVDRLYRPRLAQAMVELPGLSGAVRTDGFNSYRRGHA